MPSYRVVVEFRLERDELEYAVAEVRQRITHYRQDAIIPFRIIRSEQIVELPAKEA